MKQWGCGRSLRLFEFVGELTAEFAIFSGYTFKQIAVLDPLLAAYCIDCSAQDSVPDLPTGKLGKCGKQIQLRRRDVMLVPT